MLIFQLDLLCTPEPCCNPRTFNGDQAPLLTIMPPGLHPTVSYVHQVNQVHLVSLLTLYHMVKVYTKVYHVTHLSIAPPGVGDGERQEREEVLGGRQDKAVPVERRTLHDTM